MWMFAPALNSEALKTASVSFDYNYYKAVLQRVHDFTRGCWTEQKKSTGDFKGGGTSFYSKRRHTNSFFDFD